MANKGRFFIPSIKDMQKKNDNPKSDSLFKTYRSEKKSTADEATSLPGTSPTAAVAVAGSSTRSAIPSSSKPTTQSGCSPQVGNAESIVVNASKSKRNAAGVAVSSASAKQVTEGSAQSNSVKATSTDLRRVGEPTIKNSSSVSKTSVTEASAQSHKADAAPPQASHGQGGSKSDSTSAQAESIDSVTKGSIPQPGKSTSLIISPRQRGNPILKFIRNVPVEYGDIVADYQMGQTSCALFLSLKYHHLNPNYIHERLKQLGHTYDLRVVLVHADVKDPHHSLKELAKVCLLTDCTLILAFSPEEAGRYLETYKAYEKKPPDLIMERTDGNFMAKMTDCLTTVRRVNKTDVATLMTTFGSFERIVQADEEDLSFCPGFGPQKAKRLHSVLHEPFLKTKKIPLNTSPHKGIPSNSSEKKKTTTQLGQPS